MGLWIFGCLSDCEFDFVNLLFDGCLVGCLLVVFVFDFGWVVLLIRLTVACGFAGLLRLLVVSVRFLVVCGCFGLSCDFGGLNELFVFEFGGLIIAFTRELIWGILGICGLLIA